MNAKRIVGIVMVGILVFLLGWWLFHVWQECRAFGHTWWYCLKIIAR